MIMMKIFVYLFIISFFIFITLRYIESRSVFYPTRDMPDFPTLGGLPYEDVYFQTSDHLTLNGWFIKSEEARATMLAFHGNAGNLSHRLEKIHLFHELGVNVFIIDYRGYGKSQGRPSEEGIYKDALAAYDYLLSRNDIDKNKLIFYGDSLGGVVAVDLATKQPAACLIVDSSFSSIADVSRTVFPFVPGFVLAHKMDSVSKVKNISIPKLFIHSINDEIIPFALGKKLFDAAREPKEFLQIRGGHNTNHIDSKELHLKELKRFLNKLDLVS